MENYTVSEISQNIKNILITGLNNKYIVVIGEISNLKHSGRHTYLTLKDEISSINVVFWGDNIGNKNGDNVEIMGKIDFYTKTSNINFVGKNIKNIGIGSLYTKYEELSIEYKKKGYFNNRKPLPKIVSKIGVVTSLDGAAWHDFVFVLKKNDFIGEVYIYNCITQGTNCPSSVANGINFFNSPFFCNPSNDIIGDNNTDTIDVDIIVITRGGGSFEDLIGYSDPKVIEAIYTSKKYTISAIGHEIDNMLSDYVSNYRAPTPSVAGEVVASIGNNNRKKVDDLTKDIMIIQQDILCSLHEYKNFLFKIKNSINDPQKLLIEKINNFEYVCSQYIKNLLHNYKKRMSEIYNKIIIDNPKYILKQGFVIFTDKNGDIIYDINQILNKETTMIHANGNYDVIIKNKKVIDC